jgi:hypothetical protein
VHAYVTPLADVTAGQQQQQLPPQQPQQPPPPQQQQQQQQPDSCTFLLLVTGSADSFHRLSAAQQGFVAAVGGGGGGSVLARVQAAAACPGRGRVRVEALPTPLGGCWRGCCACVCCAPPCMWASRGWPVWVWALAELLLLCAQCCLHTRVQVDLWATRRCGTPSFATPPATSTSHSHTHRRCSAATARCGGSRGVCVRVAMTAKAPLRDWARRVASATC